MRSGREVVQDLAAKLHKDLEDRRDKLERKLSDIETWMVRGEIGYIRGRIAEIEASIANGEY